MRKRYQSFADSEVERLDDRVSIMSSNQNVDFAPPRGMRDITPEEMRKRIFVNRKIESVLSLFGYELVEPTHVERIETIFAKAGPEIEKEIYAFDDKGGRRLGLRFDLTVGMARMVATNPDWPKPLRIAAISNIWRYDQPQYGRYRSVEQWDVELFGSTDPASDAEMVELTAAVMDSLKFDDYSILVNDRQLVDTFLEDLGFEGDHAEVLRIMDKRDKITKDQMTRMLADIGLDDPQIDSIFEFSSRKGGIFEVADYLKDQSSFNRCPGVERMEGIGAVLEETIGLDKVEFDLSLVRGLDYYTGFVFECFDPDDVSLGSVLGGGRFDELVGIYGRPCPAVGCAGGIARLIMALENKGLLPNEISPGAEVLVAPVTEGEMPMAMKVARRLRTSGVSAVVDVMGRSLGNSLDFANRKGHPFVVIVGSRDLSQGKVTVRNMESGDETLIEVEKVAEPLFKGQS